MKITPAKYAEFEREYFKNLYHLNWRYGQAFVNTLLYEIPAEQTSNLFYADLNEARNIIFDNYIDWDA